MTILADNQIRKLCELPTAMGILQKPRLFKGDTLVENRETPSYLTPEEQAKYNPSLFRPLTEEDIDALDLMIFPYSPVQNRVDQDGNKIISWGSSSYGYDVRLADKFKIFSNVKNALIDPLNMSDDCYVDHQGPYCIIPPNSYVLGHTVETFNMPDDVTVICVGKSTYARAACLINVTPIEAGFRGQVVIEIANQSPLPLKVYANMGIAQFLFFKGEVPCDVSYAARGGKYQNQVGIQTALV